MVNGVVKKKKKRSATHICIPFFQSLLFFVRYWIVVPFHRDGTAIQVQPSEKFRGEIIQSHI